MAIKHNLYDKVPLRFKEFRQHLNLNQYELATKLDCLQSSIASMESGRQGITTLTVLQLSELDCNPSWLLLGVGPMSLEMARQGKPAPPHVTVETRRLAEATEYVVRVAN